MCGIIGVVTRRPEVGALSFESVRPTFEHRGPNDYGEHHGAHVHMGHARLSIQDLSQAGHQPMASSDGRYWIVFNGEIYNFVELGAELRSLGVSLRSHCDTEVLVEAFRIWGVDCVHRLRGMFAFAIWDVLERKLWMFRDRFGEKPLYFHRSGEYLLFSSEFKSILAMMPRDPSLSAKSFNRYLHYQFVPEPDTPVEGVVKCPRAHYVELDVDAWSIRTVKYWDIHALPPIEGDPARLVAERVEDAVRIMLRADVDVGLALSGGIDSGAIAAFTAKHSAKEVHSFGIGYPGRPPCDERDRAKSLADRLGIRFHDRELENERLVSFFPDLIRAIDEPIADIAAYGHFSVAKAAADHGLKVLLTGIGGDELFWGYPWFRDAAALNADVQRSTPGAPARFYDLFGEYKIARQLRPGMFDKGFLETTSASDPDSVFSRRIDPDTIAIELTEMMFDTWLVGNCLSLGDKVAMASSIETRLPFLDVELAETVIGLRKNRPDFMLGHKRWLIDALKDVLPREVLERPKSGFEPPVGIWVDSLCRSHLEILIEGVASTAFGVRRDCFGNIDRMVANKILVFNSWHQWCLVEPRAEHGRDIRDILRATERLARPVAQIEGSARGGAIGATTRRDVGVGIQPVLDARGYAASEEFLGAIRELEGLGVVASESTKVLDLLCGNGASSWALAARGYSVTTMDVHAGEIAGSEAIRGLVGVDGVRFDVGSSSGGRIAAADGSFHVVWLGGTLERSAFPADLLEEVRRVLVPGGVVVDAVERIAWNPWQRWNALEDRASAGMLPDEECHFLDAVLDAYRASGLEILRFGVSGADGTLTSAEESLSRIRGLDTMRLLARKV